MRFHSPAQVQEICELARDAALPVVFDEVMTGFGRTAKMFAFEHLDGFVPDLICLAKGLSGGVLPLAATVVNGAVAEPWLDEDRAKMLFHGHSYTANPLACATGRAGLELFGTGQPLRDAERIESFWRTTFAATDLPDSARDLRICGTVIAFELGGGGDYLSDVRARVITTARAEGVFLRPLGNTVYAMPPLCTSNQSLERIARALRSVM